jgi:DMSO/TMAO reductase YedYZ heme-binding membrane subunit
LIAGGILSAIIFLGFFFSIKDTENIWIMTRFFGIMSYIFLFTTILLGELRLLTKIKGDFLLFRFHTPVAIFSLYLVFLHFASALIDNFKWGKSVTFLQYLGFSFSDKWLIFLSLGTLAFYLMIIVAVTSARKSIQIIGFKKWKIVHYLSYFSLIIAYIHSMNLGTDLKHSSLAVILVPFFIITFFGATSLVITRMLKGLNIFEDQLEINLAAVFFILLILGGMLLVSYNLSNQEKITGISLETAQINSAIDAKADELMNLSLEINNLKTQIEGVKNG